ncbi:MAG: hypothetical protein M3Y72_22575 [Acidobacteriota bacterium]|nr:hypothetical protein [Acidobacteriota bacterium]
MLQLAQTDNGQITGTYSIVQINGSNKVRSDQNSVTGAFDQGQITLSFHGFFGLSATHSGTATANELNLQSVGEHGEVFNSVFRRSSPEQFQTYSNELKQAALTAKINAAIEKLQTDVQGAISRIDPWIADAQLHVQRIPQVEDTYRRLNDKMRNMVNQERMSSSPVLGGQLAVQVAQVDVWASKFDGQGEAVWNRVMDDAKAINVGLNNFLAECAVPDSKLLKSGVSETVLKSWHGKCKSAREAQNRFDSVFNGVLTESMNVTSYRDQHRRERQLIVNDSTRQE